MDAVVSEDEESLNFSEMLIWDWTESLQLIRDTQPRKFTKLDQQSLRVWDDLDTTMVINVLCYAGLADSRSMHACGSRDLCPAQNAALLQSETYADGDDEKMMIKSHKNV